MFKKAIVRRPGKTFADGITTSTLGRPDWRKALQQHEGYCETLSRCGVELIILEADEKYPDGCFVEDTAVVTDEVAIITRPGAPSRRGEVESISEILSQYKRIERIAAPGTVDGGDIMRAEDHFFIGLSGRTNSEGAIRLSSVLRQYGYTSSEVRVETMPHLKSGITYPGNGFFIASGEFTEKFPGAIAVSHEESYSSNTLFVNGFLLVPEGFPGAKTRLSELGFEIIELDMSEFRRMDGALTCLSILF